MLESFDFLRDISPLAVCLRMLLSVVCGGMIGLEREYKRRPAGFRTHILICLGAAITALTSQYLYLTLHMYTDVARLGAQVIAGIGFIGAGTIIVTKKRRVKGLTTAAGLWASAIIGLACGTGYIECAVAATLLILAAELLLIKLEYRLAFGARDLNLYVEYTDASCAERIVREIRYAQVQISSLEVTRTAGEKRHFCAILSLQSAKSSAREHVVEQLTTMDGVVKVQQL